MLQGAASPSSTSLSDQILILRDVLACDDTHTLVDLLQDRLGAELVKEDRHIDLRDDAPDLLRVGRFLVAIPPELQPERQFLEFVLRAGHLATRGQLPAEPGTETLQQAVKVISSNVLSVVDRREVLTSIANSVLHLLTADICGVMLVEGDELAMAACAGQRTLETQRLRMRAGQGLAGQVLHTGAPHWVDDYVNSDEISTDFVSLALAESVETAIAVPLRCRDEWVGVLEVWRRRPAPFDQDSVRLMTMVADLVSVALDNSRLYEAQRNALDSQQVTERELSTRLERMQSSADLQSAIMQALIEDSSNVDITRLVGSALGCEALLLDAQRQVRALWAPEKPTAGLADLVGGLSLTPGRVVRADLPNDPDRAVWAQLVQAGSPDPLGVVAVAGPRDQGPEMSLAIGQTAGFVALQRLAERAAAEARTEARDDLLWELVDDDPQRRSAAVDQARRWDIDLSLDHRFLIGMLDDSDGSLRKGGWSISDLDRARRELAQSVHRVMTKHGGELGVVRGERVVLAVRDGHELDVAAELTAATHNVYPDTSCWWGISSLWRDATSLNRSFAQALTAQRAARRSASRRPLSYDDLGVVGLLVSDPDGSDLADFVGGVLGPVIAYDAESSDWTLLESLAAYFRNDCSQKAAAAAIPVHHKTMRYRLDRIEELTGLDMRSHKDRQRASLAIEVLRVIGDGEVSEGAAQLAP